MRFTAERRMRGCAILLVLALGPWPARSVQSAWPLGAPIVSYWEGPGSLLNGKEAYGVLDDAAAKQLVQAGFNLVAASTLDEVRLAQRYGLRTMLQSELLTPASLDGGPKQAQLDALIEQYKELPAAYSYHITDEPNARQFPELGRIVAYLRQRDPDHLAYINLLPNTATDEQLGTAGYEAHLRQFLDTVQPALLSYDHYQLQTNGDLPWYLQNLALVGRAAKQAGVPFLNTVQACSYAPIMRVPTADETRFLVYSTLAYGAQGISYYHYASWGPEYGGIMLPDGKPLPLFTTLETLNREFVAIAREYQRLTWIDTYLVGYPANARPPGTTLLPQEQCPFHFHGVAERPYQLSAPLKGLLLGFFASEETALSDASFVLVHNLDAAAPLTCRVSGPKPLSLFNATTGTWTALGQSEHELILVPGGGVLLGLTEKVMGNSHEAGQH